MKEYRMEYICKVPTIEEMNRKWDYEINQATEEEKANWVIWKQEAIDGYLKKISLPYYGILNGEIICEASALFQWDVEGITDEKTIYLYAFRTVDAYQGQGYFSKLFCYMLENLKNGGYEYAILGVEPEEETNLKIYFHYGFHEFVKRDTVTWPDGTKIDVDYYRKKL